MQAGARHDIGCASQNLLGSLLHIHQFVQTQSTLLVIKKQIDIRIVFGIVAGDGAEQEKMLDAELFKFGFVSIQDPNNFCTVHRAPAVN